MAKELPIEEREGFRPVQQANRGETRASAPPIDQSLIRSVFADPAPPPAPVAQAVAPPAAAELELEEDRRPIARRPHRVRREERERERDREERARERERVRTQDRAALERGLDRNRLAERRRPLRPAERPPAPLRFLVNREERDELLGLILAQERAVGCKLGFSAVVRALIVIFRHAEDDVLRVLEERGGHLANPQSTDTIACAQRDFDLAALYLEAFKDMQSLAHFRE